MEEYWKNNNWCNNYYYIGYIFNEIVGYKNIAIFVVKLLVYTLLYISIMYKFFMNIEEKSKIKSLILKFKR